MKQVIAILISVILIFFVIILVLTSYTFELNKDKEYYKRNESHYIAMLKMDSIYRISDSLHNTAIAKGKTVREILKATETRSLLNILQVADSINNQAGLDYVHGNELFNNYKSN